VFVVHRRQHLRINRYIGVGVKGVAGRILTSGGIVKEFWSRVHGVVV
jgi:hypothetical protein